MDTLTTAQIEMTQNIEPLSSVNERRDFSIVEFEHMSDGTDKPLAIVALFTTRDTAYRAINNLASCLKLKLEINQSLFKAYENPLKFIKWKIVDTNEYIDKLEIIKSYIPHLCQKNPNLQTLKQLDGMYATYTVKHVSSDHKWNDPQNWFDNFNPEVIQCINQFMDLSNFTPSYRDGVATLLVQLKVPEGYISYHQKYNRAQAVLEQRSNEMSTKEAYKFVQEVHSACNHAWPNAIFTVSYGDDIKVTFQLDNIEESPEAHTVTPELINQDQFKKLMPKAMQLKQEQILAAMRTFDFDVLHYLYCKTNTLFRLRDRAEFCEDTRQYIRNDKPYTIENLWCDMRYGNQVSSSVVFDIAFDNYSPLSEAFSKLLKEWCNLVGRRSFEISANM